MFCACSLARISLHGVENELSVFGRKSNSAEGVMYDPSDIIS